MVISLENEFFLSDLSQLTVKILSKSLHNSKTRIMFVFEIGTQLTSNDPVSPRTNPISFERL